MKKTDKLKRQRYEISMRIIHLEHKLEAGRKLTRDEESLMIILRKKEEELDRRISEIKKATE
ncbi:MAG: hypothetical protein JW861_12020 [Bacteroidales bacterium]|nr:hypothetical protein [Bacteroidales bacterium]